MDEMFARNHESAAKSRVTGITLFAGRLRWYLRVLGFNPLVRAADRLEALAVLNILITALVAFPLAMSTAHLVRDANVRTANEQARSRHSVEALVVEGAGLPTDFDTPAHVRVQWRQGTQVHTDLVVTPATTKTGDRVTIWLDEGGRVVAAPLKKGDAELNAIAAAGTIWITIVACGALAALLIRRALDRRRDHAWERELLLLSHNDDGWANRRA
jgi:hypothetical protein